MRGDVDELRASAREALLRQHHELFRAAQAAVGVEPLPFEQLSERSLRLKHNQMDPLADAAIAPVLAALAAARTDVEHAVHAERLRTSQLADARRALGEVRAWGEANHGGRLTPFEVWPGLAAIFAASRSSSPDTTEAAPAARPAWCEHGESEPHRVSCNTICDAAAGGSCFTPWCKCRCHHEPDCPGPSSPATEAVTEPEVDSPSRTSPARHPAEGDPA